MSNPTKIYLFKENNRNTRKIGDICSKPTIKTLERRHWCRSVVFIFDFEHILHLFSSISIVNFEPENEYEKSKNISYFFLNSSDIE